MAAWYMDAQATSPPRTDVERALLYAVRAGVLLVMFTPLIVSTETLFPFIVGKAIFSRSVIEITFALWVMLAFAFPSYRLSRSWVLIALAIWVVMSIIAGFAGVSLQRSLWSTYERMQGIFDQVHWFGFIIMAGSVFRTLTDWKLVFSVNLGASALASLLGIGNHYDVISSNILGATGRIESTLGNATYVGAYTMVNILIGAGMIAHSWRGRQPPERRESSRRRRRRRRARQRSTGFDYVAWLMGFWLFAIAVDLWALWLSGTRGAVIALGAGVVAFALMYALWGQIKILKKVAYGIFGAVAVVVLLFILARATPVLDPVTDSSPTLNRLVSTSLSSGSIQGRLTAWRAGLRGYLDKPIFGWGPENYLIAWGRYFDSASGVSERFDQAHNKVLEELTTKGAVGAISYLAIWVAMVWAMVRSIRRRQQYEQVFVALVAAAMVGFFVQNLFLFDSPVTSLQFAILVAFAVREELHHRQGEGHQQGEATPARPLPQTGASRLAGLSYPTAWLRTTPVRTAGAGLIAVVLVLSLLFFNVRPYSAATAVAQTTNPTITWDQRFGLFQESIDDFPALANYPRMMLLSQVSNNIRRMSPQELGHALALIEREGQNALDGEPESWRVNVSLARFYQIASQQIDAAYLSVAREHLDEAVRLAPRTLDVVEVLKDQEYLEGQQ
jgi:O-antigen ligase